MKKIISIKIFSLIAIPILSMTLGSCRQDDDNEFTAEKNTIININKEVSGKTEAETASNNIKIKPDLVEVDPPVKNGTHWRTKN